MFLLSQLKLSVKRCVVPSFLNEWYATKKKMSVKCRSDSLQFFKQNCFSSKGHVCGHCGSPSLVTFSCVWSRSTKHENLIEMWNSFGAPSKTDAVTLSCCRVKKLLKRSTKPVLAEKNYVWDQLICQFQLFHQYNQIICVPPRKATSHVGLLPKWLNRTLNVDEVSCQDEPGREEKAELSTIFWPRTVSRKWNERTHNNAHECWNFCSNE